MKRTTDVTLGSQASKWGKAYEESGKHKRKIDDDVYGDNDDDVQEDKKKRVNMGVMMPEGQQKGYNLIRQLDGVGSTEILQQVRSKEYPAIWLRRPLEDETEIRKNENSRRNPRVIRKLLCVSDQR